MINIFNLFLVLFSAWIILCLTSNLFSTFYIATGFIFSCIISFISWQSKIINRESKFIFLNFGFYKHFLAFLIKNLHKSIILSIQFAIAGPSITPVLYKIPMDRKSISEIELSLFIATINIIPGIIYVGIDDQKIILHALSEKYLEYIDLNQIFHDLGKINDDSLV